LDFSDFARLPQASINLIVRRIEAHMTEEAAHEWSPPQPALAIIMRAFPASVSAIEIPLVSAIVRSLSHLFLKLLSAEISENRGFLTVSRGEEGRQRLIRRMTRNVVKSS
jgi:hypothetical protein